MKALRCADWQDWAKSSQHQSFEMLPKSGRGILPDSGPVPASMNTDDHAATAALIGR